MNRAGVFPCTMRSVTVPGWRFERPVLLSSCLHDMEFCCNVWKHGVNDQGQVLLR
jgi:hypothetical protein